MHEYVASLDDAGADHRGVGKVIGARMCARKHKMWVVLLLMVVAAAAVVAATAVAAVEEQEAVTLLTLLSPSGMR